MRPAETDDLARLLAFDPDVPGLRLLLDDAALTAWVADRLGPAVAAGGVRRTYLRWKPGAGGAARVRVGGDDLFLAVWHRDAAAKLDKTVLRGGRAVVAADLGALAVLGRPAADRDLPGLARLLGPVPARGLDRLDAVDAPARQRLHRLQRSAGGPTATTLAWKPQRRWVGLLGSATRGRVVLRAYRPDDLPVVTARYEAVADVLGTTAPALLGRDLRRGLLAVEHLGGRGLDRVVGAGTVAADRAAGALLSRLHAARADDTGSGAPGAGAGAGVGRLDVAAECRAVQAAARTLDLLVPDAGASALAAELTVALSALPAPRAVLLHGDLSADQVVVDHAGGVGLIDLDEVAVGPASYDLAGMTASWWLADAGAAAGRVRALLEGYDGGPAGSGATATDALRVRTAAHLLRRAPEAFRAGRAGWPGHVRRAVATAAATLAGDGLGATAAHADRARVLL